MVCWVDEKILEFMFCFRHWLGFYIFPSKYCQNFSQILSGRSINVFKCLQCICSHKRMEVVDSVLLCQLIVNFETRLEQIFKELELFRFPVKRRHRCRKWLCQFGNPINFVMELCRIVVVCQLLKCQQNLVGLIRRRGVSAAKLRLTCRAVLFLLSWRCARGAVHNFFVNSCHHVVRLCTLSLSLSLSLSLNSRRRVVAILSARGEEARFRMRVTLGVILIRSLVYTKHIPGRLRSGSRVVLE